MSLPNTQASTTPSDATSVGSCVECLKTRWALSKQPGRLYTPPGTTRAIAYCKTHFEDLKSTERAKSKDWGWGTEKVTLATRVRRAELAEKGIAQSSDEIANSLWSEERQSKALDWRREDRNLERERKFRVGEEHDRYHGSLKDCDEVDRSYKEYAQRIKNSRITEGEDYKRKSRG